MQPDYKVRFLHDDIIAAAAAACWKAAPPDRNYIFEVIKLLEVLVTSGIDGVFHIKGDRYKGHLEIEFFDRRKKWWEKPAWVTFGKKVKLTVDQAIWAAAKVGDAFACFILAHEIGHILLHDNNAKAFSGDKADQLSFVGEGYSAEEQANCFAGHALLPTQTVQKFNDEEMLVVLCNVPEKLAAERLATVRLIKKVLTVTNLTDYCCSCGRYTDVFGNICKKCEDERARRA
jgi:hypothetical protein